MPAGQFPVPPNVYEWHMDVTPGGALTDYSQYVASVTMTTEREPTFLKRGGGNASVSVVGPAETSGTVEAWLFDGFYAAVRAHIDQGATVALCSVRYRPAGAGAGMLETDAEAYISNLEVETDADGEAARFSFDFSVSGALDNTTQ